MVKTIWLIFVPLFLTSIQNLRMLRELHCMIPLPFLNNEPLPPRMTRVEQRPWSALLQPEASTFYIRRRSRSKDNLGSCKVSDSHHRSPWKVKHSIVVHSFNKCLWSTYRQSGSVGGRKSVCQFNLMRLLLDRAPPASFLKVPATWKIPSPPAWMKPEPAEWSPCI